MGTDKNIKLHIVTDIKVANVPIDYQPVLKMARVFFRASRNLLDITEQNVKHYWDREPIFLISGVMTVGSLIALYVSPGLPILIKKCEDWPSIANFYDMPPSDEPSVHNNPR